MDTPNSSVGHDERVMKVRSAMQDLQQSLEESSPNFSLKLREIHKMLMEDKECVTILTDEEIASIVKGLEKHAGETVVPKSAKKATAKKGPVSAADL